MPTNSASARRPSAVMPKGRLVSDAELHRKPTVKTETEATGKPPTGLMLTYPVHQAADILFCQANLVPVGLDQLPHLETTRLIARRFNERYTPESPLFPEPDALLAASPMLAGLDGKKMSKTRGNGIALHATEDHTAALIRRVPTDSERRITYDPIDRPAIANLLDLLAAATGNNPQNPRRPDRHRRSRTAQTPTDRGSERTPTTATPTAGRQCRGHHLHRRRARRRQRTSTRACRQHPHQDPQAPRDDLREPTNRLAFLAQSWGRLKPGRIPANVATRFLDRGRYSTSGYR